MDLQGLRTCAGYRVAQPTLFTVLSYVSCGPRFVVSQQLIISGALGSGLAIFTKYPIISAEAHPYSLSGCPHHPTEGDFFVNKAAGCIVLLHPYLGEVEVWSTHVSRLGQIRRSQ